MKKSSGNLTDVTMRENGSLNVFDAPFQFVPLYNLWWIHFVVSTEVKVQGKSFWWSWNKLWNTQMVGLRFLCTSGMFTVADMVLLTFLYRKHFVYVLFLYINNILRRLRKSLSLFPRIYLFRRLCKHFLVFPLSSFLPFIHSQYRFLLLTLTSSSFVLGPEKGTTSRVAVRQRFS